MSFNKFNRVALKKQFFNFRNMKKREKIKESKQYRKLFNETNELA